MVTNTYLLTYSMQQSPSSETNQFPVSEEIPRVLCNPQSQLPATCPNSEPNQFSPCTHPTAWISILILPSHLNLSLPSGLFQSYIPTKFGVHLSFSLYNLHAPAYFILLDINPKILGKNYTSLSS